MRGCRKSVVFLKNTGSEIFEEAYFVLRSDIEKKGCGRIDLIREANRIIDENSGGRRRARIRRFIPYLLSFAIGVMFALVITAMVAHAISLG